MVTFRMKIVPIKRARPIDAQSIATRLSEHRILNKADDPIIYILLYSNIKLKDFILDPKYKKHKVSIGLEKPSKGVELKAKNNSKLEYIETN